MIRRKITALVALASIVGCSARVVVSTVPSRVLDASDPQQTQAVGSGASQESPALNTLRKYGFIITPPTGGGGGPFTWPLLQEGQLTFQTELDNWNPTDLPTKAILEVLASDNVGSLITGIDAIDNGPSTTIASGSNGFSLPQATINVASTSTFSAYAGSFVIYVTTGAGQQTVGCTGTSGGNQFTGCSGGTGSMTTGGAVLGGMTPGEVRYICNENGPVDDGVIAFSNENSSSLANNRIWTPDSGHASISQTAISRFIIGPTECVPVVYTQPDQTTATTRRWVVIGGGVRKTRSTVGSLQLFPPLQPDPTTVTGTLNNWSPVDICPQVSGVHGGSCEAGSSTKFSDYTLIYVTTNSASAVTITGMATGGRGDPSSQGPIKILLNKGPGVLTLKSQSGSSSAGNQFNLPSNTDVTIPVGGSRMFWSDYVYWYPIGSTLNYTGTTNSLQCMTATNTVGNCLGGATDDGTTFSVVPGKFTATDANADITLTGKIAQTVSRDGDPLAITDNATARTTSTVHDINIVDNGSFNTTGGVINHFGVSIAATPTLSSGGNALNVTGLAVQATGCANSGTCTALATTAGAVSLVTGNKNITINAGTGIVVLGSGHLFTGGSTPTLSTCGTSPSITGDDHAGLVVTGTSASACTITWANSYGVNPVCVFQNDTGASLTVASKSATAVTLTVGASVTFDYMCWSRST